ncbi:MAG: hypothetical protein JWO02_222 [Solirubrobacterales bacterium]|nr:hypothetical protein [Solirubrobacterales bacterium]
MSVYQQVLDVDDDGVDALEELLGCTLDEAYDRLSGRELRRSPVRNGPRSDR